MKEVLLILFGAVISCGTTAFLDFVRHNRDEKSYYKRKKEEVYLEMQDFITDLNAHWKELRVSQVNNDIRNKYNALRAKAHIYGKKETVDVFYDLANDLMAGKPDENYQTRDSNFICMVKKDLKIEDE